MINYEQKFRVAYPDTDRMGTVHHSNYAKYYEKARWELFRHIGVPYQSIEDSGVMSLFLDCLQQSDCEKQLQRVPDYSKNNLSGFRQWF